MRDPPCLRWPRTHLRREPGEFGRVYFLFHSQLSDVPFEADLHIQQYLKPRRSAALFEAHPACSKMYQHPAAANDNWRPQRALHKLVSHLIRYQTNLCGKCFARLCFLFCFFFCLRFSFWVKCSGGERELKKRRRSLDFVFHDKCDSSGALNVSRNLNKLGAFSPSFSCSWAACLSRALVLITKTQRRRPREETALD